MTLQIIPRHIRRLTLRSIPTSMRPHVPRLQQRNRRRIRMLQILLRRNYVIYRGHLSRIVLLQLFTPTMFPVLRGPLRRLIEGPTQIRNMCTLLQVLIHTTIANTSTGSPVLLRLNHLIRMGTIMFLALMPSNVLITIAMAGLSSTLISRNRLFLYIIMTNSSLWHFYRKLSVIFRRFQMNSTSSRRTMSYMLRTRRSNLYARSPTLSSATYTTVSRIPIGLVLSGLYLLTTSLPIRPSLTHFLYIFVPQQSHHPTLHHRPNSPPLSYTL